MTPLDNLRPRPASEVPTDVSVDTLAIKFANYLWDLLASGDDPDAEELRSVANAYFFADTEATYPKLQTLYWITLNFCNQVATINDLRVASQTYEASR